MALLAAAGGAFAALFLGAHVSAPAAGVIVAAATVLLLSVGADPSSARPESPCGGGAAALADGVDALWAGAVSTPGKVTRVPAGERIEVRMSRGSSFEELGERAEQLACCLSLGSCASRAIPVTHRAAR